MDNYYITPHEYEIAKSNGISAFLLETRVRSLAWDKERAITQPPQKKKTRIPKEIIEIAKSNGICYNTLRYRVHNKNWSLERASTQPLQDRKVQAKKAHEASRRYPIEILELVKANNINYDTFRHRIASGWDMHKAATTPIMTSREIGLMTKHKRDRFYFRKKRKADINVQL